MRPITARLAVIGLASVLFVGCADPFGPGGDAFTPEGVAGVYTLILMNGQPLPVAGVTAGSISLQADGTYTVSVTMHGVVRPDTGTFALVEPDTIHFTSHEFGEVPSATKHGNRLTFRMVPSLEEALRGRGTSTSVWEK